MTDPALFRLRVEFCKKGRLSLLSHLEVARALERAVRRSALPFAVSQGFSPHMRIAFGAALPVGVGGEHELFDLLLKRYVDPDEALVALRRASVDDLMVLSCAYIHHQAEAASVAFPVCSYAAELSCAPGTLRVPAQVTVVRKNKEKTLRTPDFIVGRPVLRGRRVEFELESKPTGSLRPDLLVRACCEATRDEGVEAAFVIENLEPPAAGFSAAGELSVRSLTRTAQRKA